MQKGTKVSAATRKKMSVAAKKRDNTKRIAAMPKGKNHWRYNKNPSKLTLHKRIHRAYGKASDRKCVDCGKKARDWSNDTGKYTDKIEDYVPRCRKCHIAKDGNNKNGAGVWKELKRDAKGRFIRVKK